MRRWRNTYAYSYGHGYSYGNTNSYGYSDFDGNGDSDSDSHLNGYSGADREAYSITKTSSHTAPATVVSLETVL